MMTRFVFAEGAYVNLDHVARIEECNGIHMLLGTDGGQLGICHSSNFIDQIQSVLVPAAAEVFAVVLWVQGEEVGVNYFPIVAWRVWPGMTHGAEPVLSDVQGDGETVLLQLPGGRLFDTGGDAPEYANLEEAKAAVLERHRNGAKKVVMRGEPASVGADETGSRITIPCWPRSPKTRFRGPALYKARGR